MGDGFTKNTIPITNIEQTPRQTVAIPLYYNRTKQRLEPMPEYQEWMTEEQIISMNQRPIRDSLNVSN